MAHDGLAENRPPLGENPGRRVAFIGPRRWLAACAMPATTGGEVVHVPVGGGTADLGPLVAEEPDATIVFSPGSLDADVLRGLPGLTLGVLTESLDFHPDTETEAVVSAMDRVATFRPALSGRQIGASRIWRAIPPPVADAWFAELRPLTGKVQPMTVGRATEHREWTLLAAKHHHDVLQVVHGVEGEALAALMRDHSVAVYVPPGPNGFGPQVGMHLAAGQLVIAQGINPRHGLEPGLDYLGVRDGAEMVHRLDRVRFFPEMYRRVQLRGRLKAESYRASTLLPRILTDLEADVATFGSPRR